MIQEVILVNEKDETIGYMEKLAVHQNPQLHRAFSIFVFNLKGEMLLQQRAFHKYHSGGLWTNACCGHPSPKTPDVGNAAKIRLKEEMGMECDLNYGFHFIYKADVGDGLTEHELDHVFFAVSDLLPIPNEDEVVNYKYIELIALKTEIKESPEKFTEWFKIILDRVLLYLKKSTINIFQPNNPLHGITLEKILLHLVEKYGWEKMGEEINIRCFKYDVSIKSSLTFLRKTPWARERVEKMYLDSF